MFNRWAMQRICAGAYSNEEFLLKHISEKMSSMGLTSWTLVFLIIWLSAGLYLAGSEAWTEDFRVMNNLHTREWLFSGKSGSGLLKMWFMILCAAMGVLGINLVFCSWSKIYRIMRVRFNGARMFMLIVHALFGFVALGHLGGMMLGFELNNIRAGEGERYRFEGGYEFEVLNINYVGEPEALLKSRREITEGELDYRQSYAEVLLRKNGREVARDRVYLLRPLNHGHVYITLRTFIPYGNKGRDLTEDIEPGAMFTVSGNPVLKAFLAIYPLMITGIFIHLIMTWKIRKK